MNHIGFIGLGDMGGAIARRIIDAGFSTTLWARRETSYEQFKDLGFGRASTPAQLGAQSDLVGVCVFADDDVRAVLLGPDGVFAGMRPGGIVLIHSTISTEATLELAAAGKARNIGVLDAPVSGARIGAVSGKLAIMVGGDAEVFEQALPLMRAYGGTILRLGSIGSGQRMKFLNNVLGFANVRMACLALELAERLGLERDAAGTILRSGSAASANLNILLDRLLPDPAFARHAVTMTQKDTRLFQGACAAAGIERTLLDRLAEEATEVIAALGRRS
jgi:3-hydroxyisobutyrate dehydrogenase-like beta-hydroxyacid dehydrogenase